MSDQNIFNSGTPAPVTESNVQNDNPVADLLNTIKNERGEPKYKDINTALDALRHSQEFIPQLRTEKDRLEQELAAMKAEVMRLKTVEETVERLTSQQTKQETPPVQGLTEEAVANLVSKTLSQREQQTVRAANLSQVVNKMKETFGDDAEKMFYSKAQEVGLSAEAINSLAAQSPQAALQLFGVVNAPAQKQNVFNPSSSTVNTEGYQPQKESFLGRNSKPVILGATTRELQAETQSAASLVAELHANGLSTYDLTDPKMYNKYFGNN